MKYPPYLVIKCTACEFEMKRTVYNETFQTPLPDHIKDIVESHDGIVIANKPYCQECKLSAVKTVLTENLDALNKQTTALNTLLCNQRSWQEVLIQVEAKTTSMVALSKILQQTVESLKDIYETRNSRKEQGLL